MGIDDDPYHMHISRLTIDKLGVKLYDKVSAVVAELVANGYDADAELVVVELPLAIALATKGDNKSDPPKDLGFQIVVRDDGHGMTPQEAQDLFLVVGTDRRTRPSGGSRSRKKLRSVMGRKGIGKLAPFGICRRIEIISSGGEPNADGYLTSHFILDFDEIVQDAGGSVPLPKGKLDRTRRPKSGTEVVLSQFLPKRVPSVDVFTRQLARRFALSAPDFSIIVTDTQTADEYAIPQFQVAIKDATKVDVGDRPVPYDGGFLPVTGWMAFAVESYRDEEEAGVRIYARGKIVATTRDFEQPAGFTGEFTARSYLVGELHAEWLDADDDEDLVRTDRQAILWDSEKGSALREWGMKLIREVAKGASGERRIQNADRFLAISNLAKRAADRYSDESVVQAALDLGRQIGAFANEDELADPDYVDGLTEVILAVAPHQALVGAFRRISDQVDTSMEDLLSLFGQTRVAEMASYAQIASERVQSIDQLREVIKDPETVEADLQAVISRAPWLVRSDWSVITDNQGLKAFRDQFETYFEKRFHEKISVAISHDTKRPDFTLAHIGRTLYVVELKKPNKKFGNADYDRLLNYIVALDEFFANNQSAKEAFPDGYVVELIADGVNITEPSKRLLFASWLKDHKVNRSTWIDFLARAQVALEEFLSARDAAKANAAAMHGQSPTT
ncbi:MAG: ATP-binding protein [Actinobacteria bacterium]|nr:ATP-binding protein [Actinomycetota bacterium]